MIRRAALPTALLLCAALLSGCGGAEEPAAEETPVSTPTRTTPTPTPTPTPTAAPTRTPTPTPSATPTSDQQGDGDDIDDDLPPSAGGGVCRLLDDTELSAIARVEVEGRGLADRLGCEFTHGRALALTVNDWDTDDVGGMKGARSEAISSVEGEPEDLTGIGKAAFVVTGTVFGGAEIQGAGAVQVGRHVVIVRVTQHQKLRRPVVRTMVVALLEKIAEELG